jgi:hypothetical protein
LHTTASLLFEKPKRGIRFPAWPFRLFQAPFAPRALKAVAVSLGSGKTIRMSLDALYASDKAD